MTATAGNGSATVSLDGAASNGGSPITSYTVTPFIGSTAQTPVLVTAPRRARARRSLGLTNGTTYTFTVTATNAIGTGPPQPVQRRHAERVGSADVRAAGLCARHAAPPWR